MPLPSSHEGQDVQVIAPPSTFFSLVAERDREAARSFYTKYIDIGGLPVAASSVVDDAALKRTHEIVRHMLAGRPDLVEAMRQQGMYLIVIGKDQVYTDMPEYRHNANPEYLNERVRGTGGKPTSFGEENLLTLPLDRYDDESIAVHEFCHTIDSALGGIDPTWNRRKNEAFRAAIGKGLWKDTYAGSNAAEFWAEACQSFFDCNRINNWNHGPVGTREQLKAYDPDTYELVRSVFRLGPGTDWRYKPMRKVPNVMAPPAKFGIDKFYTKFTYAREFPVVGRKASDEALLAANDVIRKMFAYRHDILKALINDGVKLVVLGENEQVSDLPEFQGKVLESFDPIARIQQYDPSTKTLVVDERNVLADVTSPLAGCSQVIEVMTRAFYRVVHARPVDPNWNNRGRDVQQYELRVKRLDVTFDERLGQLFEAAKAKGLWKGSSAYHDREAYLVAGVLAYFDAQGQTPAPNDAAHPVRTREALQQYDPELFGLVDETMAYAGKVDWRWRAARQ